MLYIYSSSSKHTRATVFGQEFFACITVSAAINLNAVDDCSVVNRRHSKESIKRNSLWTSDRVLHSIPSCVLRTATVSVSHAKTLGLRNVIHEAFK